ncbi:hypothetical protein EBQ90_04950, partial [bacterium]|nr:hypothetical protein [bacterium]
IDLEEKRAGMIAKRIASIAVKKVAVDAAAQKAQNKNVGAIGDMLILLSERPDLRSWLLLPGSLQVARITLPVGKHDLVVDELDANGNWIETRDLSSIEVRPQAMNFLNYRTRH